MIPFLAASNFFAMLFSLLPLAMRTFVLLSLVFSLFFGALKEFLSH